MKSAAQRRARSPALLTFRRVLNKMWRKACVLHKMASIRTITRSYSMYLSTGF